MVSMFELSDVSAKKSIMHRTPDTSYDGGPIYGYGSADDAEYFYTRPGFEDGEVLSYFKSRRISRQWVKYWVILQTAMLFFQFLLYTEVSGHSTMYDAVVKLHCGDSKVGACKSPLWQTWYHSDHSVSGSTLDVPIHFEFASTARRPLAVQVSVLTDPPGLMVPYELVLRRHKSGDLPERSFFEYRTTGAMNSVVISDTSPTGNNHTEIFDVIPTVSWSGTARLFAFAPQYNTMHHHHQMSPSLREKVRTELKSVKIIVNEMNVFEKKRFDQFVGNMCDLDGSWNSLLVSADNNGRLHTITGFLGLSIFVSFIVTFFVWTWYGGRRVVDGLNFHYLVIGKCVLQDMPLQVIFLTYIFKWYESGGGERCQLCMLDPMEQCNTMHPFHTANFVLLMMILASSLSNQLLFTADSSKLKCEDDLAFMWFMRFVLACTTVLPFSTAMIAFNGSLVTLPGLLHTIFLIPCFTGWVTLFSLICFPITTVIDDDEYIHH